MSYRSAIKSTVAFTGFEGNTNNNKIGQKLSEEDMNMKTGERDTE